MEEQREESEFVGDCREPMEETGKGLGLSSKTETLDGEIDVQQIESFIEDANSVQVSDLGVCDVSVTDENPNDGEDSASEDENLESDEEQFQADVEGVKETVETEGNQIECEGDAEIAEVEGSELCDDVQSVNESAGEEKSVINGGACDAEQNVQTEKSQQSFVDGEMLSVAENKDVQGKGSTKKSEEGVDNEQEEKEEEVGLSYETTDIEQDYESALKSEEEQNVGYEITDAKHSESAQVPEEPIELSQGESNGEKPGAVSEASSPADEICPEEEITNVNQEGENGEAIEIDYAAEEHVGNDVEVDGAFDNAGVVQSQIVRTAEADGNDSNVVNEMEIDEQKENVDMVADLTDPNILPEDAATGEVEPLDHNALFDPSSDITNFIDFSGVSSWSGNIQDLKTDTNVSLKEDKKAIDLPVELATADCIEALKSHDNLSLSAEDIQNESSEACVSFEAESPAAATECPREASDAIMGSDENQEEKDHEGLDQKAVDQQDAMREEDDNAHETPSMDPDQKEDTEMEENPNNSDYGDVGTDSDIKTNGVKRRADVLSDDSPGEGRKTVSLAKVSFKIGACIARAASQMAGSPSVLKGSNETLSVESFVSQLHCAATDPVKENVVSEIAAGFLLDFRNSSATQEGVPEKVSGKRGRPSNSNVGGTEAFEYEEMGDTYWTDRVIHNGGEEQTPSTEKGNYQVVPVELKPSQVKKTRRPYKRRQSQISVPLPSASEKPADFDENAPAELIMKFSETDTIPSEKSLSKMFRHFGPIKESQTEVDGENHRARVVFRKGGDAEVAYNSAGRFNIFGTKAVNYELSFTITEVFKVQPYVVSLGEEDAALGLSS